MKLPSGITTEQLREHCEHDIVKGVAESAVLVRPVDLLALLVAMDLRERLDSDVRECAMLARELGPTASGTTAYAAAERVLKHEPKPDMAKVPS